MKPTPAGVPVATISPGSTVMSCERLSSKVGILKYILDVFAVYIILPLTLNDNFRSYGLGISSLVTK